MNEARLTSLLLVEERTREALFWAESLRALSGDLFTYHLNAFLSAARSVTFLMQKEFKRTPGFEEWWKQRQIEMRGDAAMRFFQELRNFSQKQGRISVAGASTLEDRWVYAFAGTSEPIPEALRYRNVADCCREHVGKLARLALLFIETFPAHACYRKGMEPEHFHSLGLDPDLVDELLGYPRGYTDVPNVRFEDRLAFFARSFDSVDVDWLIEVANLCTAPDDQLLDGFVRQIVESIEARRDGQAGL